MTNLFDYLYWRGDLTFEKSAFNNIDALILARISYLSFDNIVESDFNKSITISDAAKIFFAQDENYIQKNLILPDDFKLLEKLSTSNRFKNLRLSGYINDINEFSEKQFSAIIIETETKECFVSYRGTDSTLVGWKEDFNMSFMDVVPAQISSKNYLNDFANKISGDIYLVGHSKGGNLAVYSGAFCNKQIQERIKKIYNFDGPGFNSSVLDKEGFKDILSKIISFIPQSSIVGMLLEHKEEYKIVHSYETGIMQHDIYSWEVQSNDFSFLEKTTNDSIFYDKILTDWLSTTTKKERENFVEIVYQILISTNVTTVDMLDIKWYKAAKGLIKSYISLDDKSKSMISMALKDFMTSANKSYKLMKPKL